MEPDQLYGCATGAVIGGLLLSQIFRKSFDAFEPLWMFLTGYTQIYVIQALSYRDWAIGARGIDLVTEANGRALWALLLFLCVYYSGLGKRIAALIPRAPTAWSPGLITTISPPLVFWGMACAGFLIATGTEENDVVTRSAGVALILSFPTVMLLAGVLLIVTGRQPSNPRPALTAAGVAVVVGYMLIWMFWGRRSHSLFSVLTGVCAFYLPRWRRPSVPVMLATAVAGCLVVALAIGWRNNPRYEHTWAGFQQYVSEFDVSSVLISLNLKEPPDREGLQTREALSRETEEYGGYLLMLDTVPELSPHDYGEPYLRIVSTYIPRIIWQNKPLFGRDKWKAAWIAGSEFKRDDTFTGPAIGILGAAHLNGGALGTAIVMSCLALLIRTAYDYFRYHAATPWAQAWWSVTYFNAWLMTVNDDPFVWFYYLYGFTTLPLFGFLWMYHRVNEPARVSTPAFA